MKRACYAEIAPLMPEDFDPFDPLDGFAGMFNAVCGTPVSLDEEQLADHLQGNGGEEPERINFKAIDTDTCEMMVHIEWNRIDRNNGSTTLSRVLLDPSRRGEGLGTAMVS